MKVPMVGPITANAVVAKVADIGVFRTARDFAPWIGVPLATAAPAASIVPGRSKQGDRMLRTLLINGASSYLRHQRARGVKDPWLRDMLALRPYNVVMVALAARTARILWALLAKGERYRDRAFVPAA